jgi:hypothetical protein
LVTASRVWPTLRLEAPDPVDQPPGLVRADGASDSDLSRSIALSAAMARIL